MFPGRGIIAGLRNTPDMVEERMGDCWSHTKVFVSVDLKNYTACNSFVEQVIIWIILAAVWHGSVLTDIPDEKHFFPLLLLCQLMNFKT